MPIPETFQLNNEQCNLFLKQINDKQAKIINPKTGREIKNKQNIDKIVKWCNNNNKPKPTQEPVSKNIVKSKSKSKSKEVIKFEKIKNILKDKANKVKKKLENEKNKIFVSNDHIQICEDAKFVMAELKKYDTLMNKKVTLYVSQNHMIPLNLYKTMVSDDLINKLTIPMSQEYLSHLQSWLQRSTIFVQNLSSLEKKAIVDYTGNNYKLITGYMAPRKGNMYYLTNIISTKTFSVNTVFYKQILDVLTKHLGYSENGVGVDKKVEEKIIVEVRSGIHNNLFKTVDFTRKVVYEYINFMISIFKKAPKIDYDYYFYRGTTTDFYLKGSKNATYENPTIASFSVIPEISQKFINYNNKPYPCCMQIAKIMKGIPAIYIGTLSKYSDEFEVILPPNFTYLIKSARSKNYYINNQKSTNTCNNSYTPITTSSVVVISHNFKKAIK